MDKEFYKKLLIISGIICIMLFVLFFKNINLNNNQKELSGIDSFIKNTSTQTAYEKNTFYKKWDLLDFISFINFGNNKRIWLDLSWIKNNLDINDIYINDNKVDESKIDSLYLSWMTIVKVIWKAKTNNLDWNINQNNLIKVNILEEQNNEEETKEIVAPIKQWKEPSNIKLLNANFSSNINNLLQIKWKNLEEIGFVNIWWFSIKPQFDSWILLVSLDKDIFASWEYFLFFQLKNWTIIPTENKITFTHDQQRINIANLTPSIIRNNEDRFIVIQWNGFNKIISVQLNNNVILKNTSYNVINDNVAAIKIPRWLAEWTYYFNIMDIDKIYELKNNTFNITN